MSPGPGPKDPGRQSVGTPYPRAVSGGPSHRCSEQGAAALAYVGSMVSIHQEHTKTGSAPRAGLQGPQRPSKHRTESVRCVATRVARVSVARTTSARARSLDGPCAACARSSAVIPGVPDAYARMRVRCHAVRCWRQPQWRSRSRDARSLIGARRPSSQKRGSDMRRGGMVRTLGKVSGGVLCGIRDVFTNLHACPVSFVVKVEA